MEQVQDQPSQPENERYYDAQMESLKELFEEHQENPDLDPWEWILCVDPMTEAVTFTEYDEETGEETEHETGEEIITGHIFRLTWGGPEASIICKNDEGKHLHYEYCNWHGSDFLRRYLTGEQEDQFMALFGVYFECLEESKKVGAVA